MSDSGRKKSIDPDVIKYDTRPLVKKITQFKFKKRRLQHFIAELSEEKNCQSWSGLNQIIKAIQVEANTLFAPDSNIFASHHYLEKSPKASDSSQNRAEFLKTALQFEVSQIDIAVLHLDKKIIKITQSEIKHLTEEYRNQKLQFNLSPKSTTAEAKDLTRENKGETQEDVRKKTRQQIFSAAAHMMFSIPEGETTLSVESKPKNPAESQPKKTSKKKSARS